MRTCEQTDDSVSLGMYETLGETCLDLMASRKEVD